MTAPVTARMLAEAASADWEHWTAPNFRPPAIERLDAGALSEADFWDLVNRAQPCACWSCDHQCGGAVDPGSCGPVADVDGRLICVACREKADVFDYQRIGAQAELSQGLIRLRVDVFTSPDRSIWLDARSARHLAAILTRRAAELDAAGAGS